MGIILLDGLDGPATESAILQAISESDPLGLGKQIAEALDDMTGVENRLELFHPAYVTAVRIILSGYDFKGSMSSEIAGGISKQLDTDTKGSKISGDVLQEVFGALSAIRGIVGDLLQEGDKRILHLFDKNNIHRGEPIAEAITFYAYAGKISDRQIKGGLDRNTALRVVSNTIPTLVKQPLEIATILDGLPFIRESRNVSPGNMIAH